MPKPQGEYSENIRATPLATAKALKDLGERVWKDLPERQRLALAWSDARYKIEVNIARLRQVKHSLGEPLKPTSFKEVVGQIFLSDQRAVIREGKEAIQGKIDRLESLKRQLDKTGNYGDKEETERVVNEVRAKLGLLPWDLNVFDQDAVNKAQHAATVGGDASLTGIGDVMNSMAYRSRIDDQLYLKGHENTLKITDFLMKKATAIIDGFLAKHLLKSKLPPTRVVYILSQHAVWIAMGEKTVNESMEEIKKDFTPADWGNLRKILTDTSDSLKE